MSKGNLIETSKNNPCPHCGKPDWCYFLGELSVCKRKQPPASGWVKTSKTDINDDYYYAPVQIKTARPKTTKEFFYNARNGEPLVKVTRIDDGHGHKKIWQSHWNGQQWVNGCPDHIKQQIPIYRYQEIKNAIANNQKIFMVEGESVADTLWELGIPATTTIGGAGKYRRYGTGYKEDLAGADLVLSPDRDKPGVKHMEEIVLDFPNAQWVYAPPSDYFWQHLPKSGGLDLADFIQDNRATAEEIMQLIGDKINTSIHNHLSEKTIVNADNSSLSTEEYTIKNDPEQGIQNIINSVNSILKNEHSEFVEWYKLDNLYRQYKKFISRKLFNNIVASQRVKFNEVLPEDELRLKALLDYSQATINWNEVLPAPLVRDLLHDADKLNVDPVLIWQALLPAASSLLKGFSLDEYGGVPPVNWTCSVLSSGKGKTRADKLVFAPLRTRQVNAHETYKSEEKAYKRALIQYEKDKSGILPPPQPPSLRKYLFDVGTIPGILKRLSEQQGNGVLWARDELKGLFSSLNQYSKGENEYTEIILKLWDCAPIFVDRAGIADSYHIPDPVVPITGGIQPDVFRKVFKDSNDANGMQARFLFAMPQERRKKYIEGDYLRLNDRLPALYDWLDSLNPQLVKLAPDAREYFANLVNTIEDQIEEISHPGIRTWMNKVDTHILRIALVLHCIECFYRNSTANIDTLSLDTLKRAVHFAQYYRSTFHVLQERVTPSDDIASIMLQIHTVALDKHPDGITARDVYRLSRIIQNRAKAAGREAGAYVVDLFEKMSAMGYGEVVRKGRSVRFVAVPIQKEDTDAPNEVENNYNSPESPPPPPEDSNCNQGCCQKPIVDVDNQTNTEILREEVLKSDVVVSAKPQLEIAPNQHLIVESTPTEPQSKNTETSEETAPNQHLIVESTPTEPQSLNIETSEETTPNQHLIVESTQTEPQSLNIETSEETTPNQHQIVETTPTEPQSLTVETLEETTPNQHLIVESTPTEPQSKNIETSEETTPNKT